MVSLAQFQKLPEKTKPRRRKGAKEHKVPEVSASLCPPSRLCVFAVADQTSLRLRWHSLRGRDDPKLLQHPQRIPDLPALHDLAIGDPLQPDTRHEDLATRGRDAQQITILRSGAMPTRDHRVAFSQHFVHVPVGVGEALLIGQDRPRALPNTRRPRRQSPGIDGSW